MKWRKKHVRCKAMNKNWTSKVTAQGRLHNVRRSHRGPHDSRRSLRSLCPYTRWFRDLLINLHFNQGRPLRFKTKLQFNYKMNCPNGYHASTTSFTHRGFWSSSNTRRDAWRYFGMRGCRFYSDQDVNQDSNLAFRQPEYFCALFRVGWRKLRLVRFKWVTLQPLLHFVKTTQSFGRKNWRVETTRKI